jgi:hypothetical protein
MGEFPNKATQFSKERQPEKRNVPRVHGKTILKRFLSIEMDYENPVTGETERLSVAEIMYLKQIAKSINDSDFQSFKELCDRHEGKTQASVNIDAEVKNKVIRVGFKKPEELEETEEKEED